MNNIESCRVGFAAIIIKEVDGLRLSLWHSLVFPTLMGFSARRSGGKVILTLARIWFKVWKLVKGNPCITLIVTLKGSYLLSAR